jgi:hypothetical protein
VPGAEFPKVVELLAERVKEWTKSWVEQGAQQGRHEGEAALLLRLLERKFGPVPEEVRQRVAAADSDALLAWSERVLTAETLEEVFGGKGTSS